LGVVILYMASIVSFSVIVAVKCRYAVSIS
jgi:hypothetical protein